MKFRKKPVVIEAEQWLPGDNHTGHIPAGINQCVYLPNGTQAYAVIKTLEGDMRAQPGDWIIRGVKGEYYPCKPDIFEQTYEQVSD